MTKNKTLETWKEVNQKRDELFESLSKESDRGVVLTSASFLDEALEVLLRERFSIRQPKSKSSMKPLFQPFGPLSTFSGKITICYAIDLIGKWMYEDLEIVRKLRNEFAHSFGVARFDLPISVQLTERLKAADFAVTITTKKANGMKEIKKRKSRPPTTKAHMERTRFTMSVTFIGALLWVLSTMLKSDATLQDKEKFIEKIRRGPEVG
jgi:DNA-binding MltR family transcriptional regulator